MTGQEIQSCAENQPLLRDIEEIMILAKDVNDNGNVPYMNGNTNVDGNDDVGLPDLNGNTVVDGNYVGLPDVNGNTVVDGRRRPSTVPDGHRRDRMEVENKEIDNLSKHETMSQRILEVAGLQQTVNIAVFFVKEKFEINYMFYITAVTIVVSIVAQILLASIVVAKIWIRKCAKDKRKRQGRNADDDNEVVRTKDFELQRRMRRLEFITLLLSLFISILTTILLATSGMIVVAVEDRPIKH